MKRCPLCHSLFPDTDQFCELDGVPLVAHAPASSPLNWIIIGVIGIVGVTIGIVLVVAYQRLNSDVAVETSDQRNTNAVVTQRSVPLARDLPTPDEDPSPSPEVSPSPSEVASPSVQPNPARVLSSSSEVSTGRTQKTTGRRIIIQLTSGNTIEADDVWETSEGIWYRRSGIVSLLPRDRVKSIDTDDKSSPVPAATPSASP